ncbi:hypothetical protein BrevBR_12470 [Brevundimonas sp. BR2-1]|uniref:hypothetical protein n=1 Tax=Brevundimonas sp. BR2-1 TaxID=3031123 RepID=UPI0030B57C39
MIVILLRNRQKRTLRPELMWMMPTLWGALIAFGLWGMRQTWGCWPAARCWSSARRWLHDPVQGLLKRGLTDPFRSPQGCSNEPVRIVS